MRIEYRIVMDDRRCIENYNASAMLASVIFDVDMPRVTRCSTVLAVDAEENAVIGYAVVVRTEDGGCELFAVYVDPLYRGAGIGTELVRRAISTARRLGCGSIQATVVDAPPFTNAAAMRHILAKLGFRARNDDVYELELTRNQSI